MANRFRPGEERSVPRSRLVARARVAVRMLLGLTDRGAWISPGVLGCAYPRTERALAALSTGGVRLLVNLHGRAHDPDRLGRHGMREVHLPVEDFAAPSDDQIERGVNAIRGAVDAGEAAAVHCGGGLGRMGTQLACYLASAEGLDAAAAIRRVRVLRPGSVETPEQAAAVYAWARRV